MPSARAVSSNVSRASARRRMASTAAPIRSKLTAVITAHPTRRTKYQGQGSNGRRREEGQDPTGASGSCHPVPFGRRPGTPDASLRGEQQVVTRCRYEQGVIDMPTQDQADGRAITTTPTVPPDTAPRDDRGRRPASPPAMADFA